MSARARPLLGCIADDFTGATDLANQLVRGGMRTVQTIGVPTVAPDIDVDAIVVALKSRTIPASDAVGRSLAALDWLRELGCGRFFFKYCSTFDSTDAGNIGPVAVALMDALGADFTIACPAFPETGRSIYRGHLFVGDALLAESSMRDHPLTPMTDSNLVRVLQRQTDARVGLLRYDTIARGATAIGSEIAVLRSAGVRIAIADALSDGDLHALGEALAAFPLITGGSGIAIGLPANFRRDGSLGERTDAATLPAVDGDALVLAGSSSSATNAQVARWVAGRPAFRVDPMALHRGEPVVADALAFARRHAGTPGVLIYATATPADVKTVQAELGVARAGELVETALADVAKGARDRGVRKFVVAGGETSGAVVAALGVRAMRIGAQIDPGVPVTMTIADPPIAMALKSGNFGGVDFFEKAIAYLGGATS